MGTTKEGKEEVVVEVEEVGCGHSSTFDLSHWDETVGDRSARLGPVRERTLGEEEEVAERAKSGIVSIPKTKERKEKEQIW